jgi:hypothetical protein
VREEAKTMKRSVLVLGMAVVLASSGLVSADSVNCKKILKELQLPGRTVKDVAENNVIDEDEVKKCQEQAAPAGEEKK